MHLVCYRAEPGIPEGSSEEARDPCCGMGRTFDQLL